MNSRMRRKTGNEFITSRWWWVEMEQSVVGRACKYKWAPAENSDISPQGDRPRTGILRCTNGTCIAIK